MKQRIQVLAYAAEHGLKPAARHFALSRTTVREWRDRRDGQGPAATALRALSKAETAGKLSDRLMFYTKPKLLMLDELTA